MSGSAVLSGEHYHLVADNGLQQINAGAVVALQYKSLQAYRHGMILVRKLPLLSDLFEAKGQAAVGVGTPSNRQEAMRESNGITYYNPQFSNAKPVRSRRVVRGEQLPSLAIGGETLDLQRLWNIIHDCDRPAWPASHLRRWLFSPADEAFNVTGIGIVHACAVLSALGLCATAAVNRNALPK